MTKCNIFSSYVQKTRLHFAKCIQPKASLINCTDSWYTTMPVCRVWHFLTRFPVRTRKLPGVPVCTVKNFCCAGVHRLLSLVLFWCSDYSHNLLRHRIPVFGDVRGRATGSYEVSKIGDRIKNEHPSCPHVLKDSS